MSTMLGSWLEEKRSKLGLTKGQMSEKLGVVIGQYSAYVAGKSIPRAATITKIAEALSASEEEIHQLLSIPIDPEAPGKLDPMDKIIKDADAVAVVMSESEFAHIQEPQNDVNDIVLEGKLDIIISMLKNISSRLCNLEIKH